MLKFVTWMHRRCSEVAESLTPSPDEIQDGIWCPNWTYLHHNKSAADCLMLLKFGVWVHCGCAEIVDLLKCRPVH